MDDCKLQHRCRNVLVAVLAHRLDWLYHCCLFCLSYRPDRCQVPHRLPSRVQIKFRAMGQLVASFEQSCDGLHLVSIGRVTRGTLLAWPCPLPVQTTPTGRLLRAQEKPWYWSERFDHEVHPPTRGIANTLALSQVRSTKLDWRNLRLPDDKIDLAKLGRIWR